MSGWLASCSALIDDQPGQCLNDLDCERIGLPGKCQAGVCIAVAQPASTCEGSSCRPAPRTTPRPCSAEPACTSERDEVCFKEQCLRRGTVAAFLCDPPEADPGSTLGYSVHVQEFVSEKPPKGLVVAACRSNDVTCEAPVARFVDEAGTGDVTLELPNPFSGYLELRSQDALTSLFYFTQPLVKSGTGRNLLVVAPQTLQTLAVIAGLTVDDNAGLVILEAFDCNNQVVGGVHFDESKGSGEAFFLVDALPNTESAVTVRDETNNLAIGGFLNAAPGFTIFSARLGVDGPLLGHFNANVRARAVTYVDIHP